MLKNTKGNPLISIVTPSYNCGRFIDECIQSVLKQDYPNVEHIIQDSNSTDETVEILKRYMSPEYKKRIKIFVEPDKGQSDGLDKAIKKSKGDILLVLNTDDILMSHACSWAVEAMVKNPEAAVVYGDNYVINEEGEITGIYISGEYNFERLLCVDLIPTAQAAFIRRSMFEKVGLRADANMDTCPDYEMWIRIAQKFPMKHVFGVVTKYRVHSQPQLDSGAPRTVERFIASKKVVMDRFFNSKTPHNNIRKKAYAGLNQWAGTVSFQMNMLNQGYYFMLKSFMIYPSWGTFFKICQALHYYGYRLPFYSKFKSRNLSNMIMDNKLSYWLAKKINTSFEDVSSDRVKDFWDNNPCNIRHSPEEISTKRYYDDVEKRKYLVEPHIPKFAEFKKWKGKKVLEIGCGIGTDTINFARAGAKVTAVEISKKSLAIAKKRAEVYAVKDKIKFYLANAEELSKVVPVEPYDLIYSFGVIHHTPFPHRVVNEINKYVGENTTLKVMVYNRFSWKVIWILFKYGKGKFWTLGRLISEYSEAAFGSPVTYTYTKSQAKNLLNKFKITEIKADHIFPYRISEYRAYEYKKVWYFRYIPELIFHFLESILGWHLLITAIRKDTSRV